MNRTDNVPTRLRFPKGSKWGSVRKVRFKSQLCTLVKYAVENNNRKFMKEDIRRLIEEDRAKRESLRLLIIQTGSRRALSTIGNQMATAYLKGVEETVAFAKGIGLFEIKKDILICPPHIEQLYSQTKNEMGALENGILELLLKSRYGAYLSFLIHLRRLGGVFSVPTTFRKRTRVSGLSAYLYEKGFLTDVASFSAMRDLFYDFGLLNWRIDPPTLSEQIYLTSNVAEQSIPATTQYSWRVDIDRHTILYDRTIVLAEFRNILSENYLDLSGGIWGIVVSLLELRDRVVTELRISDNQFNRLIVDLWKTKSDRINVELSQGTIAYQKSAGMLIKALNVPPIGENTYATYVRIYEGGGA
jgi:hypothetical protein